MSSIADASLAVIEHAEAGGSRDPVLICSTGFRNVTWLNSWPAYREGDGIVTGFFVGLSLGAVICCLMVAFCSRQCCSRITE